MLKTANTCLTIFVLFIAFHCRAQQEWNLVEERYDISLYEWHEQSDSLRRFMAVFTIPANLHSCTKILYEDKYHTSFMDGMKSSELLRKHHEKSLCFYQVIDLPWPIPNRDMVTHADFDHTPDYGVVTVRLRSDAEETEPTSMTRMEVPDREWSFARLDDNTTQATYRYWYNPTGIPSIFEEMFTIDGPMKMMSRFREMATKQEDNVTEVAWLKNQP